MKNLNDLRKYIKRTYKKYDGKYWGFLGFVENQDLSPEVRALFEFVAPSGYVGYDWVNGNAKLKEFIKQSIA